MLTNASPTRRHLAVLLGEDWAFCSLVASLAFSTGYVGATCLASAPKRASEASRASQEAASLALTAFFVAGQAAGSAASYFVVESL